jgi:hypothetical protein
LIPPHLWTNEIVGSGENKKTANPFLPGTTHTLLESWIGTRFFLISNSWGRSVPWQINLLGLAYQGKDIVFRFIIDRV